VRYSKGLKNSFHVEMNVKIAVVANAVAGDHGRRRRRADRVGPARAAQFGAALVRAGECD
jgi:hypothetical protein